MITLPRFLFTACILLLPLHLSADGDDTMAIGSFTVKLAHINDHGISKWFQMHQDVLKWRSEKYLWANHVDREVTEILSE